MGSAASTAEDLVQPGWVADVDDRTVHDNTRSAEAVIGPEPTDVAAGDLGDGGDAGPGIGLYAMAREAIAGSQRAAELLEFGAS